MTLVLISLIIQTRQSLPLDVLVSVSGSEMSTPRKQVHTKVIHPVQSKLTSLENSADHKCHLPKWKFYRNKYVPCKFQEKRGFLILEIFFFDVSVEFVLLISLPHRVSGHLDRYNFKLALDVHDSVSANEISTSQKQEHTM